MMNDELLNEDEKFYNDELLNDDEKFYNDENELLNDEGKFYNQKSRNMMVPKNEFRHHNNLRNIVQLLVIIENTDLLIICGLFKNPMLSIS